MRMPYNIASPTRPPVKRRRVLFNCDGSSVFVQANESLEQWVRNVFTGLENSHVDALLWCDGAGGNTASYDSKVLELTGQRIGKVSPFLRRLIAEGNDPPGVVVREAKRRGLDVFYSFRINDIHDDFVPEELPTFKVQHPEWLIGNQAYGYKTALNFAIPEVRALKLAVIEELFDRYDFDGIEIDLLRSPPFFLPGQEPAHAYILTEFLRTVRRRLDERAHQRGRAIEVAARVDENLEACRLDGFDVATWVEEGLADLLILGSGVMDIEVEEFKRVVEGTGMLVYPCLYGWPSSYMPIPAGLARGLAANYWHQGGDGLYTFNWFPHEPDKAYQIALLNEIGDPSALRGKPMMFAADRGKPLREYPHNWMRAVLPVTLEHGQEATIPIMVGEDLAAAHPVRLELRIECEPLSDAESLTVRLNQRLLPDGTRSGSSYTLLLAPGQVTQGRNHVMISLTGGQLTVKAVEVHVGVAQEHTS